MKSVLENRWLAGLLVAAGLAEALPELKQLFSEKWPLHFDSFYYLVEFRNYMRGGNGNYDLHLPFFYFSTAVGRMFGLGEQSLLNIWILVSFLFFCLAVAWMARAPGRPVRAAAVGYLALSSQNLYVSHYAYLKQASGLTAFAWMVLLLVWAAGTENPARQRIYRTLAAVLAVFTAAFHKFSGLLVILFFGVARTTRFRKWLWALLLGSLIVLFSYLLYKATPGLEANFRWNWPPRWYAINAGRRPYGLAQLFMQLVFSVCVMSWLIRQRIFDQRFLYFLIYLLMMIPIWGGATLRLGWYSSVWIFFIGLSCLLAVPTKKSAIMDMGLLGLVFVNLIASATIYKPASIVGYNTEPSVFSNYSEPLKRWIPEDALVIIPDFNNGDHFEIRYFLDRRAAIRVPAGFSGPLFYVVRRLQYPCAGYYLEELARTPNAYPRCVYLDKSWAIVRA